MRCPSKECEVLISAGKLKIVNLRSIYITSILYRNYWLASLQSMGASSVISMHKSPIHVGSGLIPFLLIKTYNVGQYLSVCTFFKVIYMNVAKLIYYNH